MSNPFNPAPGAVPARIIGRETELAAIREAVRRAKIREAPTPVVFVGQRGMGKTVLLGFLRELGARETLAVAIESLPDRSLTDRLRDKIDGLLARVEPLPSRAGNVLKRAIKALPSFSYELPHQAGAIALGHAPDANEQRHDHDSLVGMLWALQKAARVANRYLMITIDEIQDADVRSMQTLTAFVHESAQSNSPVLLSVAGLNETRDLIDKLRTYVQRWDIFDLRLLTLPESVEAIREPILDEGASIDEDALYSLATESGGYPFFIQAYASAAWTAHQSSSITLADVERSVPGVRRRNEMSFYIRPLAKLTPREMALVLVLAELGPGPHSFGAVARAFGRDARDISSTRAALNKKAIISSPVPGLVEFRIPFTDRFLRDHAEEYRTADVQASINELSHNTSQTQSRKRQDRSQRHGVDFS